MTYQRLFTLLNSLGFEEQSVEGTSPAEPRIFFHSETDTLLMYHGESVGAIVSADLLSTEMRLQSKALIVDPLETLLEPTAKPSTSSNR